jgi:hypothetical protein
MLSKICLKFPNLRIFSASHVNLESSQEFNSRQENTPPMIGGTIGWKKITSLTEPSNGVGLWVRHCRQG